jgi:hypothetical protein
MIRIIIWIIVMEYPNQNLPLNRLLSVKAIRRRVYQRAEMPVARDFGAAVSDAGLFNQKLLDRFQETILNLTRIDSKGIMLLQLRWLKIAARNLLAKIFLSNADKVVQFVHKKINKVAPVLVANGGEN